MLLRTVLIWLAILVLASVNGFARQALLIPSMGETAGRAVSTVALSLVVAAVTWFALPWIRPASTPEAWTVGIVWVLLTLAFEFLAGHYLFGNSWESLLADYDVAKGRIWILVLITTLLSPPVVYSIRRGSIGA